LTQGHSPSNPSGSGSEPIESHGHDREGSDSTDALIDRAAAAGYQGTVDPLGSIRPAGGHRVNAVLQTIPTGHHIAIQLQLRELEQREVILADGRRRTVLGNAMLLGAIPMQDMDLVLPPMSLAK